MDRNCIKSFAEIKDEKGKKHLESNSLAKVQIPYTCINNGEFAVKVLANYSNGKQYTDYATLKIQTLQFKPEGKIQLQDIPQSLKVSETMQGTLSIINVGEDAMLNVTPKIEGLDISIPVFSRIDPKKEVVFPIKISFESSGTKTLKVIVEYEDEIGKKYSVSEERTIMVKGLQLKPSISIEECTISGRITYYNHVTDRREELDIPTKSVSIICPLLKVKEISEEEWRQLTSNLIKAEDTTKEEIPLSAKSLFNMVSEIIKDMNLYMLSPSITEDEKFFRGVAKFYGEGVKELKYAAQISDASLIGGTKKSQLILKSWAEREDALTGLK